MTKGIREYPPTTALRCTFSLNETTSVRGPSDTHSPTFFLHMENQDGTGDVSFMFHETNKNMGEVITKLIQALYDIRDRRLDCGLDSE